MTWQQIIKIIPRDISLNLEHSKWDDKDTKTAIQSAYNTIYRRMARTDNKTYWRGFQHKQKPIGSPAHFYNFIKRLLNDKRIKQPLERIGWRDELALTDWPSKEFNRRWKVWGDMAFSQSIVKNKLDALFTQLEWFDAKIVTHGDDPPYNFNDDNFKEWRQLQMDRKQNIKSGKKVHIGTWGAATELRRKKND